MVPWTAGKIVVINFFCNFNIFISRFDFQNVYVKPHWPKFSYFFVSKNKNSKKFKNSQKFFAYTKNEYQKFFAIPFYLFMEQDAECFFIFLP